jgi:outer membrane protein assembly factor BamA
MKLLILIFISNLLFAVNMPKIPQTVKPKSTYFLKEDENSILKNNIKKILKEYSILSFSYSYDDDKYIYNNYGFQFTYGKQITKNLSLEIPLLFENKKFIDENLNNNDSLFITTGLLFCYNNILNSTFGYNIKNGFNYPIYIENNDLHKNKKFQYILNFELNIMKNNFPKYGIAIEFKPKLNLLFDFHIENEFILLFNYYIR